jgi:hypothetical protein
VGITASFCCRTLLLRLLLPLLQPIASTATAEAHCHTAAVAVHCHTAGSAKPSLPSLIQSCCCTAAYNSTLCFLLPLQPIAAAAAAVHCRNVASAKPSLPSLIQIYRCASQLGSAYTSIFLSLYTSGA